jgi:hypothetical protein
VLASNEIMLPLVRAVLSGFSYADSAVLRKAFEIVDKLLHVAIGT